MSVTDPARMGARAARDAIRAGRLSAVELTEACIDRIVLRDNAVRAWHFLDPALPRAEAAERTGDGILGGVPVAVKDIIATETMPTACGSQIYRNHHTGRDAACVAALRVAGGVVMGKSATTEFAAYTPTDTRNPHNPIHTPGGSSSGSAAAVADFQVPLAIGTQTAGSVIRPASFCGIVGFKPSFGTIDVAGVHAFAASLDTLGVFARSVEDAGLFAGAMAGWPAMSEVTAAPPSRVRVVRAPHWHLASAEAQAALDRAARCFAKGHIPVDDLEKPERFDDLVEVQDLVQIFEGRRALAWERARHADLLSCGLQWHLDRAGQVPFKRYWQLREQQIDWQRQLVDLLHPGDIWLTISAPGEAPEGLDATGDPVFCRAWTLLHVPCISVPCGNGPQGLPLGVQLIAPRGDDIGLLAAAAWLEARLD